jgi:translocation and assembly module TamB
MVKRTLKIAISLLFLLFLLMSAGLAWLVGSTDGAVWIFSQIKDQQGVQVEGVIKGSIWSGLDLTGVNVSWAGGHIETDLLQLDWQPLDLLRLQLTIDRLEFGTIRVVMKDATDEPTAQPTEFDWPLHEQWQLPIDVELHQLIISEFIYGAVDNEQRTENLYVRLSYADGELSVNDLHVGLSGVTLDGTLNLDLKQRRASVNLVGHGTPVVADWDGLQLQLFLDKEFQGSLEATVLSGSVERLTLQSDLILSVTGATLNQLIVSRKAAPDRIEGRVQIDWIDAFKLTGDLDLKNLNLEEEAGWPTDLSGSVQAELNATGYAGTVDLVSARSGLEKGRILASVTGGWDGLHLDDMQADWLEGEVTGSMSCRWEQGVQLSTVLHGENINPAALVPEMNGRLQLTVSGSLQISPEGELSVTLDTDLEQSQFLQRSVSGRISGAWLKNDLVLTALDLQGEGMQLKASGRLSRRIDLQLKIADLSRLGKGWSGGLQTEGWLAHQKDQWLGAVTGNLAQIAFNGLTLQSGRFQVDYPEKQQAGRLDLLLTQLEFKHILFDDVVISGRGRLDKHRIDLRSTWSGGDLAGLFSGGWKKDQWEGRVDALSAEDQATGSWHLIQPAALIFAAEHLALSRLELAGEPASRLTLDFDLQLSSLTGTVSSDWQNLPLHIFDPWLGRPGLFGLADGVLNLQTGSDGDLSVTAEIQAAPILRRGEHEIAFSPSTFHLNWNEEGLRGDGKLNLAQGGRAELTVQSPLSGRLKLPETGQFSLHWTDFDLKQMSLWLPDEAAINGQWQGAFEGGWALPEGMRLAGQSRVEAGELKWRTADGLIILPLKLAELEGGVSHGWLDADLKVNLADQGRIESRFHLPLSIEDQTAPIQGELRFNLAELGLFSLLIPGATQETQGRLTGDLKLAGSRQQPEFSGRLGLRNASANVSALGLELRNAELDLLLNQNNLKLERLQLDSGSGRVVGDGELHFSGWKVKTWQLNLKGENVQLVHLPEVTLDATPDLQLSGTSELIRLRGELLIPNLLVSEAPKAGMVEPSEDVVLTDAPVDSAQKTAVQRDVRVKVKLGKHVVVKAKGLDAKLTGAVLVASDDRGALTGQGTIFIEQGHYSTYGLKLPITRGRASFSGGSLQDPVLDVLAERTIGEVKAGVLVSGTPRKPQVKLVSTPAMPDTEILSYIVLGRPLGGEGGDSDLLMLAAGALLSRGESAALQEKLKQQIGVDVIEVQSGDENGVEGSMVTVGKYLTPDLYLSFGRSIFSAENVTRLRYQLGEHWEVESQFGSTSGADLSYRIEFR